MISMAAQNKGEEDKKGRKTACERGRERENLMAFENHGRSEIRASKRLKFNEVANANALPCERKQLIHSVLATRRDK